MKIGKTLTALSVLTLAAAPAVAQASDIQLARGASPVAEAEGIAGGGALTLLGFAAALLAIIIIVSDDDEATSP